MSHFEPLLMDSEVYTYHLAVRTDVATETTSENLQKQIKQIELQIQQLEETSITSVASNQAPSPQPPKNQDSVEISQEAMEMYQQYQ